MDDTLAPPVVLIVEDEWLICDEIADEFRRAGWRVVEASSGEGCLALAQSEVRIDAVVTDVHLAGEVSGWDVAEALRAIVPDIAVVYATANPIETSRMVEGSVFFTKPCRTAELLDACRKRCHVNL